MEETLKKLKNTEALKKKIKKLNGMQYDQYCPLTKKLVATEMSSSTTVALEKVLIKK